MEGEDGVTDPPTKEQEAAMAKSDKENGAASEKYAVRADRINDGNATSTSSGNQTGGNSGKAPRMGDVVRVILITLRQMLMRQQK